MAELRHVLKPSDLTDDERAWIVDRAIALKKADPDPVPNRLRVGGLYFDPSLRTRASFEQAVRVVGGACQTLNASADTWTLELDPEAVMDGAAVDNIVVAARVLGRIYHLLGVRSFRRPNPWAVERTEPVLSRIAEHAGVPIISLEGTSHHPCQGLADLQTLHEQFGDPKGLPVALVWSWHPRALPPAVPHTFLLQAALAGCDVAVAHPPGFELDVDVVTEASAAASARGGKVTFTHDRAEALRGRRAVYVKSWGPLDGGGPTPAALRAGWTLGERDLHATDHAKVMHCLPVRRNVVISSEILDGPRSVVTEQAGNRLWAQAALVEHLARQQGVIRG